MEQGYTVCVGRPFSTGICRTLGVYVDVAVLFTMLCVGFSGNTAHSARVFGKLRASHCSKFEARVGCLANSALRNC